MSQFRLLEKVVKILSERNIPYMLTGSIVSSLQGILEPLFEKLKLEADIVE